MKKAEQIRITNLIWKLEEMGFSATEVDALRRISNTLQRWFERETGSANGCIERDETGKPFFRSGCSGQTYQTPDRETGARKRLAAIMARHAGLGYYVQRDCRGAALYILRPGDVPEGKRAESYYTRGICVF